MFGVEPPRGCDYEAKHIQSIAQVKNETHTKSKVASGNKLNQCFDAGKNKNNQKSKQESEDLVVHCPRMKKKSTIHHINKEACAKEKTKDHNHYVIPNSQTPSYNDIHKASQIISQILFN